MGIFHKYFEGERENSSIITSGHFFLPGSEHIMFFLLLLILFRTWNPNPCYSRLHFSASFNDIMLWYDIEYKRAFTSKSSTNIPLNAKGRQGRNSEHLLIKEFGFCGPKSIPLQRFEAVFCHRFLSLNLLFLISFKRIKKIFHIPLFCSGMLDIC